MGARRRAREAALQILFASDVNGDPMDQVEHDHWAYLASSREGEDFASELVRGYAARCDEIDELIGSVSENWRVDRMARVDRNVLRLAAYELKCLPKVPRRVTLNEAIELAKRYGSEGSPGFVNGVLDRIANDIDKR